MAETKFDVLKGRDRGSWIKLRTITLLRWAAIAGQITAILVAQKLLGLNLELSLCMLVISVSVVGNLIAMFIFPESKRLSESENLLMVLFDLIQLSLLLFLTGGLHNPFSILILGPVTVSASALSLRSTLLMGLTAILAVTLLTEFHLPLRTEEGFILRIPQIFVFGNWIAIVIAVIFLGVYSRRVTVEMHAMSDALQATYMALSREQKLTDIGGVVAAAAHELGTPLATIKLTSSELTEELSAQPELQEDARLIGEQADRCRDILRSMGRAGKDDLHMRQAPLMAVVQEAAEPHLDRGKALHFQELAEESLEQPSILRRPEIIHGLRNLIQNGVDFASTQVWIEAEWDNENIIVRIMDDGKGYPTHLIGRIGEPFVRRRRVKKDQAKRPGYEGMGLGLFIAKTLLERTGADLSFANGQDPYQSFDEADNLGAIVEVTWPRRVVDANFDQTSKPLAQNLPLEI
ncbi:MAG: ActS/PrrB/RegB family redox-sensitive histidine kinase [Thalassovita sp.]